MSIALYRKYRPKNFEEVVSQSHVKTTLLNAVSMGKIGHAYIFVGARGIGKTTIARLFAKAINCQDKSSAEPCNKCEHCKIINSGKALDLLEIDAASNRGIEEIRELREKVRFTPAKLKYKVFIIDEVHMLTKEAFNALLKTLEEPPEHAVFLLATTEAHKVMPTVLSRCQRFDLRKLTVPELVSYLSFICKKEGVDVSQESLELISQQSEGCARDAVSLLTQLVSYAKGKIDQKLVKDVLGITDQVAVSDFVDILIEENVPKGIEMLRGFVEEGYDLEQFNKNLIEYLRKLMLLSVGADVNDVILADLSSEQLIKLQEQAKKLGVARVLRLIKVFLDSVQKLGESAYPQLPLEMALIKVAGDTVEVEESQGKSSPGQHQERPVAAKDTREVKMEKQESTSPKKSDPVNEMALPPKKATPAEEEIMPQESSSNKDFSGNLSLDSIDSKWQDIIQEVTPINHSLAAFLKMGVLQDYNQGYLTIAFKFRFHKEQIAEHKYRTIVEDVMTKVFGEKVLLKCIVDDKLATKFEEEKPAPKEVENVSDAPDDVTELAKSVFGGKLI